MRVLLVHDYGGLVGGAEHMSVTLRDGLRARGHDARLLATTAEPVAAERVADELCFGTMGPARKVLQAANPLALRRLREVLAAFAPDVVHLRMFMTQLSPLVLRALRDVPTVLHAVNYDLICPINTKTLPDGSPCRVRAGRACHHAGCIDALGLARVGVQGALLRRGLDAADVIVANSDWVRRRLRADGVDATEVIWNGVPRAAPRPPLADAPVVAYAGRLVAKKGVDVLVRAMADVVRRVPAARLVVAGDGPERARLERLAPELGIGHAVVLLGHLPRAEVERAVGHAWIQVVPSVWEEPFGIAAAEAMMRGTAVVVSGAGGLSEYVAHGRTGFSVAPGDAGGLGALLGELLGDRDRLERVGRAGRAFALAELTEDRTVERFAALYGRLLQTGAGAGVGVGADARAAGRTSASTVPAADRPPGQASQTTT